MSIKTHLLQGKAKWVKIIGAAPAGYDNGPAEWTFDLILDKNTVKEALSQGVDPFYIRENKDGESFLKFSRKAVKQDGTKAKAISVVDHAGRDWDDRKIGNDSTLNVCYTLNTVKSKGQQRQKPSILSVQVWNLVKFSPAGKGPFHVRPDQDGDEVPGIEQPKEDPENWAEEAEG